MAVTTLILYLVLTPQPPAPPEFPLFEGADKVVHAIMMGTLAATVLYDRYRAGLRNGLRRCATVALWVMAFGVRTGIMQGTLTDVRSPDPYDVLADWVGTIAASAVTMPVLRCIIPKKESK